jgi:hypothetical protein
MPQLAGGKNMMRIVKNKFKSNSLVERSEGMRQLGRPRCRWENNIRIGLRENRVGNVEWIGTSGGTLWAR